MGLVPYRKLNLQSVIACYYKHCLEFQWWNAGGDNLVGNGGSWVLRWLMLVGGSYVGTS